MNDVAASCRMTSPTASKVAAASKLLPLSRKTGGAATKTYALCHGACV